MKSVLRTRLRGAATAVVFAVALVACGGAADTTTDVTATDDSTATSTDEATATDAATATDGATAATPTATDGATVSGESVEITAVNYAFEGVPDSVPAGTELTLTNASTDEVHEMVVFRVDDDETRPLEELVGLSEEEAGEVTTFAGVSFALPGEAGINPEGPVVLDEPGRYIMLCFIPTGADPEVFRQAIESQATDPPEPEGGPPHFTQGMAAELVVQ